MKAFNISKTIGLTTILIILISCSAEDGAIGPAGPQGEQGIQGEPGTDGNANVIASEWLDVTFAPTISDAISTTIMDERITQEVLDNAVFLVYARISTIPNNIVSLPFTDAFLNTSYYYILDSSVNQLQVLGVSLDGSSPRPDFLDQMRFVIIPATTDPSSLENLTYDDLVIQFGIN